MIENELNHAFNLVSQSNNSQIKEGQAKLVYLRKDVNYPINLLSYINQNHDLNLQLRAAIELKLWCKSYEEFQPFERSYYQQVIEQVKSQIVLAYLVMPKKISETLRPGIVKLTDVEFPKNWQALMLGLMQYANQNSNSIHSVLLLIQDITKKYSILSRSDPLYEEIILVCDQTHDFLLDLTVKIIHSQSKDSGTLEILETLMNIFYHLNYQDLHPKFEDNANNWMSILKQIMGFTNENQMIFKCKGAALQSILLYANKYKEDVEQSIKGFSSEIWDLCSNATEDPEYDSIVFNCLKYFKSIILWQEMKQFFVDNLGQLIQKLIMPNLNINRYVLDMFNDDSETFFDYYFKNNDLQTRRSASLDLLRVICRSFPNFESYVIQKIKEFTFNMSNPSIQQKCNLLNFVIDASTKSFRDVDGCTDTYIDNSVIIQCFQHIVYNDLAQIYSWILENQTKMIENAINQTLLITCMRFCYFFRIFIPTNNYEVIIKFAAAIKTNSKAIKTMLFMTINAFITVRHGDFVHFRNFKPYFNSQNSHGFTIDILQTIYKNDQAQTVLNQHLTKMLYTLAKTLGQGSVQYYEYFDAIFPQMLLKTEKYDFKSVLFLFEAIGVIAYHVSKKNEQEKDKLENHIFNYFNVAIKRNSDLLNFCFQILAIFLYFENKTVDKHKIIYESLLNINNWVQDNISVMSSYIQYISAYLNRSSKSLVQDKTKFQQILSRLFQLEHYDLFFRFIESILKITSFEQFYQSGYFKLSIMGSQAVASKNIFSKKTGILFIFKLMNNYELHKVVQCMNSVSPSLFQNVITGSDDIIRTMQLKKDRKLMYLALCKVISLGILSPQIEGSLLSLLIQNSTNKFSHSNIKNSIQGVNQSQKKEGAYQKLQIFAQIQIKQNDLEVDEEEQLCKTYIICENGKRDSLSVLNPKNQERIGRLKEKHGQSLGLGYQGNQGGIRRFY